MVVAQKKPEGEERGNRISTRYYCRIGFANIAPSADGRRTDGIVWAPGCHAASVYLQPFRHAAEDANLEVAQPSRHGLSSFGRVRRCQLPAPPAPREPKTVRRVGAVSVHRAVVAVPVLLRMEQA